MIHLVVTAPLFMCMTELLKLCVSACLKLARGLQDLITYIPTLSPPHDRMIDELRSGSARAFGGRNEHKSLRTDSEGRGYFLRFAPKNASNPKKP